MVKLIILDWDDTLFPTSWIKRNKIDIKVPFSNEVIKSFLELDAVVFNLLKKLRKIGFVVIVSNAYDSWIKLSCGHLMNTYNFILKHIPIISARALYEYKCNYTKWKHYVFMDIVNNQLNNNSTWSIISIGDADHEHNALINLWANNRNKKINHLKSVKFLLEPSMNEIIDQLVILTKNIEYIRSINNHAELKFNSNWILS